MILRYRSLLFMVGLFFLYLSNGANAWAVAPWLALPCLLLVTRQVRPWRAYWLMAVSFGVATQFSLWHFTSTDARQLLHYVPLAAGLIFAIPYALDSAIFHRKGDSGLTTLLFPLTYTTLDYANSLLNPFGTMGTLPYSQADFLVLTQLVSVTGLWGITFLITWFGSTTAYAVARIAAQKRVGKVIAFCYATLALVVLWGSWRVAQPPLMAHVQVAGLHVQDRQGLGRLWALRLSDPVAFRATSDSVIYQLMLATRQQARAGASVVVWSEVSPPIYPADEHRLLDSLTALAKTTGIYLVASPYVCELAPKKDQNKLWLINPNGQLVFSHLKYGGNLLEGCLKGSGELQAVTTSLGILSGVICWDGDFPQTMRQLTSLNTGLLLIPAADWQEIDPLHTTVAQFRGIENGCSVVRQTLSGRSVMTDPYGRLISQMDHFGSRRWVMQGNVPSQHLPTVYGQLGDWFAWLCLAGLGLFGWQRLQC